MPPHISHPPQSVRLLDQVRERMRYLHYSFRTEQAYLYWVRFFIRWHTLKHPRDMGSPEVQAFLTMLASQRKVSVSTHNQALSALLFLYREVLATDLPWLEDLARPTRPKRIPTVLTPQEITRVLQAMDDPARLVAQLLYGTGMRLLESLRLRVKDVDFERGVIVVREAKGNKDRVVMLPHALETRLRSQLTASRVLWDHDRRTGQAGVAVPHALESKYPNVGKTWGWFWVFPSPASSTDPDGGAMIYTHVLKVTAAGTRSPLDALVLH